MTHFKDPRHQLGFRGEETAARWLQNKGWQIAAHRWQLGRNDLDLIARQGELVAFIEVKVRRNFGCGEGVESVGPRKRRTIERVAWSWIVQHGKVGDQYRFDVISLRVYGDRARIRHYEDAWRPGWR